jgi:proteasome activator subunit 4
MFYNEDPRRLQPLVDFIMNEFHSMDFNGESSFDAVKVLSLFRSLCEGLNWKFSAWIDEVIDRCWPQIQSEHDEVSHFRYHQTTVRFPILTAEY